MLNEQLQNPLSFSSTCIVVFVKFTSPSILLGEQSNLPQGGLIGRRFNLVKKLLKIGTHELGQWAPRYDFC